MEVIGLLVLKEAFGGKKDFDRKIFLDCVLIRHGYKKTDYNQNFSDMVRANDK